MEGASQDSCPMTTLDPAAQVPGAPLDQPCTLEMHPLGAHSQYQAVGTFRERALDPMVQLLHATFCQCNLPITLLSEGLKHQCLCRPAWGGPMSGPPGRSPGRGPPGRGGSPGRGFPSPNGGRLPGRGRSMPSSNGAQQVLHSCTHLTELDSPCILSLHSGNRDPVRPHRNRLIHQVAHRR